MNEQNNLKLFDGFLSRIQNENNLILNKSIKIKSRTFTFMNLLKKILRK